MTFFYLWLELEACPGKHQLRLKPHYTCSSRHVCDPKISTPPATRWPQSQQQNDLYLGQNILGCGKKSKNSKAGISWNLVSSCNVDIIWCFKNFDKTYSKVPVLFLNKQQYFIDHHVGLSQAPHCLFMQKMKWLRD